MVVIAYGLLLPQALLEWPRLGCVNLHASLLPRWRGAAPIQRAVLAGDAATGISVMQMDAGLDTGPRAPRACDADRRARNRRRAPRPARCCSPPRRCWPRCPRYWRATLVGVPQRNELATVAPKIAKSRRRCSTGTRQRRRARAAGARVQPVAGRRGDAERRPSAARLRGDRRFRPTSAAAPPGTIVARQPGRHRRCDGRGRAALASNSAALGPRDGRRGLPRGALARTERHLSPKRVAGRAPRSRARGGASSSRACCASASGG